MNNLNSSTIKVGECKYHVVWIPKCRRKVFFDQVRKDSKILEGHLPKDPVHVLISIPSQFSCTGGWLYKRQKCNLPPVSLLPCVSWQSIL